MKPKPTSSFDIFKSMHGRTLGEVLPILLKDRKLSEIERLIHSKKVQIDGNVCVDPKKRLQVGAKVRVFEETAPHAAATLGDVRIVHSDEFLVVVDKPAGMTSTRGGDDGEDAGSRSDHSATLEDYLPRALTGFDQENAPPVNPLFRQRGKTSSAIFAVHRLDYDTSGLMVFARTKAMQDSLVSQFAKHDIDRVYQAVAFGDVKPARYDSLLVRDRGDGKRGSAGAHRSDAQRAITHVSPLRTIVGKDHRRYTLVECKLETGKTHQIRIHLAEAGHPLCGDRVYRGPFDEIPIRDESKAPRQALHATKLGFEHPATGKAITFQSKLPRDLATWLARLGK